MTEVTFCGSLPTEESSNKVNFINKFGILNSIRIKIKCHIFFMIRNLTRLTFPCPFPRNNMFGGNMIYTKVIAINFTFHQFSWTMI